MNRRKFRKPTHPGLLFLKEVLEPSGVSIENAAKQLSVSRDQLNDICSGKAPMTTEIAGKVAAVTGTTIQSWLNMQKNRDFIE